MNSRVSHAYLADRELGGNMKIRCIWAYHKENISKGGGAKVSIIISGTYVRPNYLFNSGMQFSNPVFE